MKERPKYTVLSHFEELRRRILIWVGFLFVVWIALFTQFQRLIPFFLRPYEKAFPGQKLELVFTSLPEAIMAALKSTFFLALTLSVPVLIFQAWRFLSPALYPSEKKVFRRLLFISIFLGITGAFTAYFLIFPPLLKFFLGLGYQYFEAFLRLQSYFAFFGKGLLIAVLLSELPLATALLIKLDLLPQRLGKKRHFYLLALAYGGGLFLAPGDLLSQIILASVFFFLFEIGFLIARLL